MEVRRWRSEADRLARERDARIAERPHQLPPTTERDAA
jgi:hypothetical protein